VLRAGAAEVGCGQYGVEVGGLFGSTKTPSTAVKGFQAIDISKNPPLAMAPFFKIEYVKYDLNVCVMTPAPGINGMQLYCLRQAGELEVTNVKITNQRDGVFFQFFGKESDDAKKETVLSSIKCKRGAPPAPTYSANYTTEKSLVVQGPAGSHLTLLSYLEFGCFHFAKHLSPERFVGA
tara:strand:+ start:1937 stop:2473 length:537 start_codon:yes stop_codon:yes gene_type:complete